MSDMFNLLSHLDACKKAWNSGDYIQAAIDAYWCIQYCKDGEPYGMPAEELRLAESEAWKIYRGASKKYKGSILSKTTFIYGTICEKLLWLYKHEYNLRKVSKETQKKFDRGHNIGSLAQKLFPGGIDVAAGGTNISKEETEKVIDMSRSCLPYSIKQYLWVDGTTRLYRDNILYEGAFVTDDVFAAVDILVPGKEGHIAYEVKSSFEISDTIINDCALQYYVISNKCKLSDFIVIYINQSYLEETGLTLEKINENNVDIGRIFIKESIVSRVLPIQSEIRDKVRYFKTLIKKENHQ